MFAVKKDVMQFVISFADVHCVSIAEVVVVYFREATLKVSDRILAIGGINTLQSNLSVALAILKNTEEDVHLLVEYDVSVMGEYLVIVRNTDKDVHLLVEYDVSVMGEYLGIVRNTDKDVHLLVEYDVSSG